MPVKREYDFRGKMPQLFIKQAVAAGLGYQLTTTTYTLRITSPFLDIYFRPNMAFKAFQAARKIKADITDYLAHNPMPNINRLHAGYYKFNIPQRLQNSRRTVYNIDIKSAYKTVLKRHGLITDETGTYLDRLKKMERLAAVGMLAANKMVETYNEENTLVGIAHQEHPFSDFFYFCILETQQLMRQAQVICGNDFLFYWVDGIYFQNEEHADKIKQYLTDNGYNYSFDILDDFTAFENDSQDTLFFRRRSDGKKKIFRIPKPARNQGAELIQLLGLHDINASVIEHQDLILPTNKKP